MLMFTVNCSLLQRKAKAFLTSSSSSYFFRVHHTPTFKLSTSRTMNVQYKIAQVDDLKDGQMKEIVVGETKKKVLLSRVDGTYYATSHLCPHYKAPLIKGSISHTGRIICPWHGACFNAKTGDIEDAPSIDSLQSYQVKVVGNDVVLEISDESRFGETSRASHVKHCQAAGLSTVVIVGGGAGGLIAADTLRKDGFDGKIVMISSEPHLPIDRIKLSKGFSGGDVTSLLLRKEEYYKTLHIDVQLGRKVVSVNTKGNSVQLDNGKTIPYSNLILATGGEPRTIPVSGSKLSNIFPLRFASDATAIDGAIKAATTAESKPNLVVIGSSFIGMEAAAFLSGKCASVTVIGMETVPFERVLGVKVGTALQKLHESNGVKLRMKSGLDHFEASAKDPNAIGAVVLTGGEKIPADLVILGVGVRPQTDYLKGAEGITLEKDGSVLTDEYMQVTGSSNIFAVGDIARFPYNGHVTRIEHWNVAQQQGRVAAQNILASSPSSRVPFKTVPYFWTMQFGKGLRYCGHALSFDDVIIDGDADNVDSLSFVAYYVKDDKVLAVASIAKDPVVSHASLLFESGRMPSASQVRSGINLLEIAA